MNNKGKMHLKKILLISCVLLALLPSAALADLTFSVSRPTCTISPPSNPVGGGSYDTTNFPTTISISADNSLGISLLDVSTNLPSPSQSVASTATSLIKTYSWTPATGTYNLSATAANKIGNAQNLTQSPCSAIYVINSVIGPWIQAVGDVHSNDQINASGGP